MDREDPERRFGLYAPTPKSVQPQAQLPPLSYRPLEDLPSTLTLRQLLNQTSGCVQLSGSIPFLFLEFQDKLQLAVVVAVNILPSTVAHGYRASSQSTISFSDWKMLQAAHIHLRFPLSSDLGFPIGRSSRSHWLPPILWQCQRHSGPCQNSRKRETTVFSFGLLLIQIMLGGVISELDLKPAFSGQSGTTSTAGQSINNTVAAVTVEDYMGKRELGKEFEGAVLAEAGPEFLLAVTRCLNSFVNIEGLQSERFCQEFYAEVISMLQDALGKALEL